MPFFQFNTSIYRVMIGCLFLALSLAPGCVSQETENVETMEKQSASMEKETLDIADSQISENPLIQSVRIQRTGQGVEALILGNRELKGYTSIKQAFPFGIAVYLSGTGIDKDMGLDFKEDDLVQDVKVGYADQDQTTAKVEILLKQDISYEVKEEDAALRLVFSKKQGDSISLAGGNQEPAGSMEEDFPSAASQTGSEVVVPDTRARLTDIRFDTARSGRSDILVETSHPVKYELVPKSPEIIDLNLYNTLIPDYHQRSLKTQYFDSAVEEIIPTAGKGTDSKIQIHVRDQVPYRVFQNKNLISVLFEPSDTQPPVFDKAVKTAGAGQTAPIPPGNAGTAPAPAADNQDSMGGMLDARPVYTGEKIKLDFYETDVKNVFRILRSVSGLNFAIDKDVQGKVTMTLEEPVPWDQVLDLVLKMNSLGKKMEGNVIRIATLETLKTEELARQDAIAAIKKSQEQKESLEPLITEYIPINYSDAAKDIEPHIKPILTKERGNLSVDQRTNMIIVTDTQAKVDHILEMIYRLDTVTPQIIIEAKIVEVTKKFSRKLGIGWNLSNASGATSGFIDDFDLSLNSSGIAGDFSFFRLFGSSVTALNAQLEASEEQGDVKIVSSPRILTLDNKKARIKQGVEYAYLERDDSGGSSVKFKDIDLLLEVTPHVTPDKRISMTVKLTKNDLAGETTTGVPTLNTNEAETELLVNNQDTVVIGGIVKTTKTDNNKGLPFLTGIPVLGHLFGSTSKEDDRNELLIFMTPSIVQLEQKRNVRATSD
ncbi:type IV pilus secretin PilQ [Desulfospira joergensenii]|uniref:type IV pilus secretin PilQ n=1 Tax=Desulfospira joergensenii TaxID=53329 RepID=UPI0003B61295|nr:type IV pilus secretin PilQ [Desulfospira joergensenii]